MWSNPLRLNLSTLICIQPTDLGCSAVEVCHAIDMSNNAAAANDNSDETPPQEPETVRIRYPLHPSLQDALDREPLFD